MPDGSFSKEYIRPDPYPNPTARNWSKNLGDLKPPDDEVECFDQFLKTTTTAEPEIAFEEITTGNGTEKSPYEVLHTSTNESSVGEQSQQDHPNRTRLIRAASTGMFETQLIVSCSIFGSFTSSRERWWYIAITNCDGAGRGLHVKYRFRITNGPPGDFWHKHFSADDISNDHADDD
uniref:GPR180-like N-terminal domain-containing protein n=1 Tax=Anopheles coluzzii TaxID=1518534 RepID=A0A8W7PGF6_ANOCL